MKMMSEEEINFIPMTQTFLLLGRSKDEERDFTWSSSGKEIRQTTEKGRQSFESIGGQWKMFV